MQGFAGDRRKALDEPLGLNRQRGFPLGVGRLVQGHQDWSILESVALMAPIALGAFVAGEREPHGQAQRDRVAREPTAVERDVGSRFARG